MLKNSLRLTLVLLLFVCISTKAQRKSQPTKPNILVIMVDIHLSWLYYLQQKS